MTVRHTPPQDPDLARRLYGILSMYADMTDGDEAPLAGVIYITGNDDIDRLVRRLAVHADLTAPKLSFRTLDQVVEQTREAAHAQREAVVSV
jgi:hypothetical protein